MRLVKDEIIFSIRSMNKSGLSVPIWDSLIFILWNRVEAGIGMRHSTPASDHFNDWIGDVV